MVDSNKRKELAFNENSKSIGVAYLLWLLFGWIGVHRFYAGETKTAIIQLILGLTVVGLVFQIPWWLVDAFLVPGMINKHNKKIINMLNYGDPDGAPAPPPGEEPRVLSEADRKRDAMLEDLRQTGYRKERRDMSHLYR